MPCKNRNLYKNTKPTRRLNRGRRGEMFTQENTEGYTNAELGRLNAELEERLEGIDDPDEIDFEKKNFSDEVARR